MPPFPHFNRVGHFAQGGIATLTSVLLEDGSKALLRELQTSKLFNIAQQLNFRRGIRIRAGLSPHPNLANTLFCSTRRLRPFEMIEFIEGRNLKYLMNSHAAVLREHRLFVLAECAEALAWLHQNRIMHLDIKPENFLIRTTAAEPVVKLTDFDLAHPSSWNAPRRQMGTPAYMAPEQFTQKTAFPATDVFAFSILAYQLLTGKQPFAADTVKQTRKLQASLSYTPKPPDEAAPDIPRNLSRLIMAGLEKKLQNRIPDMLTFRNALKALR